ncbi:MAG: TolC family protein [Ahniella sp.]|nr:TolC family protein [Ahniella sp.]
MLKPLSLMIAVLLLGGCTVGPDYVRPDSALPQQFDQASAEAAAITPPSQLWASFQDPELDRLIARAMIANNSVKQAFARLEETRALSGLSPYSLFPTVTADADGERSKPSGDDPFIPSDQGRTDSYQAGFDAIWEIDLFGSLRNQNKAIKARVQADAAELAQVRLSIVAETAQAYFSWRGALARRALAERNFDALAESVQLIETLERAGRSDALAVARIGAQRSAQAARVAQLEAEVVRHEQRLSVLTAQPLATLRADLTIDRPLPSLPELVAVGSPQDWLQRRPDVAAAERRLAAAFADVGTQTAEYFPKLTLLGGFGWTAQSFGDLGNGNAERWRWGPSLSWSFLDFGRVRQQVRAADARADGVAAAFEETVLRALEEVENALAGYRASNRAAVELDAAAKQAGESARLAKLRFEVGADDALSMLDAERTRIDFESQALDAQVARATAPCSALQGTGRDFAASKPE